MRRNAVLALVALVFLLPAGAFASTNVRFGLQDDAWLQSGTLDQRLALVDKLGPDVVRYTLRWDLIARIRPTRATNPNDKAYDWRIADRVLAGLRAHRVQVLITLWGAPSWANGGRAPNFAPVSKWPLSSFAVAAIKRYPYVKLWEVWNEPNLRTFLRPNSPSTYVSKLLNPTYDALHATRGGIRVAGGATSPRQTPTGMAPIAFMRGMRAAHARLDAYSHHPYPTSRFETPTKANCRYCKGLLSMARLLDLIREVRRDFGNKRIWLTEYGYQTNPPDRALGVSKALQARYLAQAARIAYKAPYVDLLINFLVRDETPVGRWQSGLFTAGGVAKPSFRGFSIPLTQLSRRGLRTVLWGQVRPGFGRRRYVLQRAAHGRWNAVGGARWTSPWGYFSRTAAATRGTRFRVVALPSHVASLTMTVR
jgi:Glycosyl hydrolases family 39